jgi:hypothetical protein
MAASSDSSGREPLGKRKDGAGSDDILRAAVRAPGRGRVSHMAWAHCLVDTVDVDAYVGPHKHKSPFKTAWAPISTGFNR